MRQGTVNFEAMNVLRAKPLRLVVSINFGTLSTPDLVYITSHADISIPGFPVIAGVLKDLGSISQRLNPIEARAEIGTASFKGVDKDSAITQLLADKLAAQKGARGKQVKIYTGFKGLAWSDYRLEQTQVIDKEITYKDGEYSFSCSDIQREMRKDIFDLARTRLSANLSATGTTVNVYDTTPFSTCVHGTSYSDAPSATVGYGRIKYPDGFDIFRYTGKTGSTFTGVTRNILGATAVAHTIDGTATAENGPEVEEYVYIELPLPKAIYALLTGKDPHTGAVIFPPNWHLGIDTAYVNTAQFLNVGPDLYVPGDDTKGFIVRMEGLTKTDGKKFIEKELLLLGGLFMPVNAAGQLGLKRMASVLTDSSYVDVCDVTNVVKYSALKHDLDGLHNDFQIDWAYLERGDIKQFVRRNRLIDATSQAIHGPAKPYAVAFRALHSARHTASTIKDRFNGMRDRHSGPPLRITLDLLPSKNGKEVGDVDRITLPQVRDYTGNLFPLDRSFEVQGIKIDQTSQRVTADYFGSSAKAAPISDGNSYVLADAAYDSPGVLLSTVVGISGGFSTGNGDIPAGVYRHAGDLTLQSPHSWTFNGTTVLWVRGVVTINGVMDGEGRGGASGAGYFGTTIPTGAISWSNVRGVPRHLLSTIVQPTKGLVESLPDFAISNSGSSLGGLPSSLIGSKGGQGGSATRGNLSPVPGGAGGNGGAGLIIICRGLVFGASGKIITSGINGVAGTLSGSGDYAIYSGSGGGGAPGGILILLDGSAIAVPIINGHVDAYFGDSQRQGIRPKSAYDEGVFPKAHHHSYYEGRPRENVWQAAHRVQYIPKALANGADTFLNAGGVGVYTFRQASQPNDSDAQSAIKRNLIAGDLWLDSSSGDRRYRYNGSSWVASDIESRLTSAGRPLNQRFMRAFHLASTQAAKTGTAPSATDAGSTATITVNAWSVVTDLGTINYNSGSITGLAFNTEYYVYAVDPDLNGGAVTYAATTDYTAYSANADRVKVGAITTPVDGGGGTGGGGGGGDWCVAVTAWLPDVAGGKPWRAAFAHKDRPLWVLNDTDDGVITWPIRSVDLAQSDCVTLETETGIRLTLSVSTPITLKGGGTVRAPDCLHLDVPVLDEGAFRWERVTRITQAGMQMVARIHVDQLTYAAGDQQHRYILTHNPEKP